MKSVTTSISTPSAPAPGGWGARLVSAAVWATALLLLGTFLWIIADMAISGLSELSLGFFVEAPLRSGRAGGIGPILVSTLLILLVCLAASVPLGLATALWLAEFATEGSRFGRWTRASLDVLAGVPSIVFGLFGNAFFCVTLGMGFSILSGGLTLACMVLPIFIRSVEMGLRSVPDDYRRAGAALAMSRARLIRAVLLPAAAPGIVAGLMLGIGRAVAETAALIFTSGYVPRMPESLYDSGRALSVHIYDLAMNVNGGERRAYATALVLVVLLILINATANYLVERFVGQRVHRVGT